jgi:hypothetical protein
MYFFPIPALPATMVAPIALAGNWRL